MLAEKGGSTLEESVLTFLASFLIYLGSVSAMLADHKTATASRDLEVVIYIMCESALQVEIKINYIRQK